MVTPSPWKHPTEETVRIGNSPCPSCGHALDSATALHHRGAQPDPGDISICFYCAAVNRFALGRDGLVLEAVTGDDLILTLAHPDVKLAVAAVRSFRAKEPAT